MAKKSVEIEEKIPFQQFWDLYPRKTAKKIAIIRWERLSRAIQEVILIDVPLRAKSKPWREAGGQYIPYPATYLYGERWNDEIQAMPEVKTYE